MPVDLKRDMRTGSWPLPKDWDGTEGIAPMAMQIMSAAMELFARKGYSATSVREIVQAAEVTNPMLYYYFESKEGLFHKLINLLFDGLNHRLNQLVQAHPHAPLKDMLARVLALHLEAVQSSPVALQFIYAVLFGPRDARPAVDPIAKRVESLMALHGVFERAIDRGEFTPHAGVSVEFMTVHFFGMLNQHLLMFLYEHAPDPMMSCDLDSLPGAFPTVRLNETTSRMLLEFFLRGAGTLHEAPP